MRFRFTPKATVGYQDVIPLIASEARRRIDTVEQPDYVAADASRHRLELADKANALEIALMRPSGGKAYLNGKRCKDYVEEGPQ